MVLLNDFKAEPAELKSRMEIAIKRVINSGWYVLGKELEQFEEKWAKICGVKHAIGVGNGMDAIEIAIRSIGIGSGDEIITTSMTAFASVLAIIKSGAIPVLADIDPQTGLTSIDSARRCITKKTKAILLVHLYGQLRDMDKWQDFCEENSIHLIEDCAQAHIASWGGRRSGSFGIAAAFSFYPTKNLGAIGDAGIITTNDDSLSLRSKRLRNYGQTIRYHHPELGCNSRLDELHAAILIERQAWLEQFTLNRRKIARAYHENIKNREVNLLAEPQDPMAHVYHLFVILCKQRNRLSQHLESKGIQSLIHYPIPIHRQKSCEGLKRDPKGLFGSEIFSAECLSIPCHPQMTDFDLSHVVNSINAFS